VIVSQLEWIEVFRGEKKQKISKVIKAGLRKYKNK
jgi:hypothetical protein